MYQPPAFREDRQEVQHALIRAHPLGLLITAGPGGLMANPIPFTVDTAASERGVLRAHLARANPQLDELASVSDCLVAFQGPHDYVTPSWYATKQQTGKVVPTWNYATVHVWGAPRVVDDADWLRKQFGELTRQREAEQPRPWAVEDAPEEFISAQVKGIVGLEIEVRRMEGKWKMSQNRSLADRIGVIDGLEAQGGASASTAALVTERSRG